MILTELSISGYRSIKSLRLRPSKLTVVVGPNGSGKTNLYRALQWLAAAASGNLAKTVIDEGGMASALWAGERTKGAVRIVIRVTFNTLSYEMACGLPIPRDTHFFLDPEIKEERVTIFDRGRRTSLLERDAGTVRARDESGAWVVFPFAVSPSETALGELREPHRFPVLSAIRQELMEWRFYHHFRTDLNSPLRWPRPGCQTPVLDHQGHDLAAALATIDEIGNRPELARSIDRAFPGCTLEIRGPSREHPADGFSFALKDPNFQRSLGAGELSDGTLHYLCLVAALMSPRPPNMLVLNEPETSIYPQLLEPLACLIAQASENSQVWLTTHSQTLAESLHRICGIEPIALCKTNGATQVKSIE